MKIKNFSDLACYLGAHLVPDYLGNDVPSEAEVSRRVYKDTACGAWAKFEYKLPPHKKERQHWKVDIKKSIVGPFLWRARRAKGRKWYTPDEWPPELLEFCGGAEQDSNGRWRIKDEEIASFVNQTKMNRRKKYWDAELDVYIGESAAGVSFGSIVEGVEGCTNVYTVRFPCDSSEIDEAIQMVEDEAREIWDETHGCPSCWDGETVWSDFGYAGPKDQGIRPVDPECPECKGQGIII